MPGDILQKDYSQSLCAAVQLLDGGQIAPQVGLADTSTSAGQEAGHTPGPRRFKILAHTGNEMQVWGYRFVIDLAGIEYREVMPALRQHQPDRIVGMTDGGHVDAQGLHLTGVFLTETEDSREVLALADAGFPWQASIGVSGLEVTELAAGATAEVNGRIVTGPVDIWRKSAVREISFVALGADPETSAVSMAATNRLKGRMEKEMEKKEGQMTEQQLEAPAHKPVEKLEAPQDDAAQKLAVEAALAAEQERASYIMAQCKRFDLGMDAAQKLISEKVRREDVAEQILALLEKKPENRPLGQVVLGMDESDKFRPLAAEGLAMSLGLRVENPQEGSRQYRNMGLADFVRLSLEKAGINCLGLSRSGMADKFFSPELRLAASTSDFSGIFADVTNKLLLQAYTEAGRSFLPWVSTRSVRDFKQIYGVSLSEVGELELVHEGGEYREGSLTDRAESYKLAKYGKIISITWEMIVNDDLGAFSRMAQMLGAAWARTQSEIVYGLLAANPLMSDGKAVFSADHGNLADASAIDDAGLAKARLLMRNQRGAGGARLNLQPSFLLVPPSQENAALVLLNSAALPTAANSGAYNVWKDSRIQPIVEARLEADTGASPWYLLASPNQAPTIDVAYLNGSDALEVVEHAEYSKDVLSWKARGVMGAGWMDWRGAVKNPGVTA